MVYSVAERYAAFLITYLPRLAAVSGSLDGQESGSRYVPLIAAHEYAKEWPGVALEFGVFKGASINYTGKRYPNRKFYGFDSFEGFPDDGRQDWDQDFSVGGNLPAVPGNVTLIKGFFSDTLPSFMDNLKDEVRVVNIDCDIYSSTCDIFKTLVNHKSLRPGVVLSFDELVNYQAYLWNEMFALFEMLETTGLGIRWLSVHQNVRLIEETIALRLAGKHPNWTEDLNRGYRQQASLVLTNEELDLSILNLPHCKARVQAVADFLLEASRETSEEIQAKLRQGGEARR